VLVVSYYYYRKESDPDVTEVNITYVKCTTQKMSFRIDAEFSSTRNDIVAACKRDIQIAISLESQ